MKEAPESGRTGVIVVWIIYEILQFMMFWSHLYTMTTDPGIIPRDYRYKNELLPDKFKTKIMVKRTEVSPN